MKGMGKNLKKSLLADTESVTLVLSCDLLYPGTFNIVI